jgi:hypothetical protein
MKAAYPVEVLCRVLDVARSGFYAWCRRPIGVRAQQNAGLLTQIRTCYQAAGGRYGSPRIHQDLRVQGLRVGRPADAAPGAPQSESAPTVEAIRWGDTGQQGGEHLTTGVCGGTAQ